MKIDFNDIKTKIALPEFLLKLGWKFAPGSSSSSPKMTDGQQTIVIKMNNQGHYTCWNVHSDSVRGKSIIDLMQNHILQETGKMPSLRQTAEVLYTYLNSNEIVLSENSKYNVSAASLDNTEAYYLLKQLRPYTGDYLQKRGISDQTLSSPVFSDTFYIHTFKNAGFVHHNVCTKMINEKGFQGISQRNEKFKGVIGSKFDSISVSRHDDTRPIERVYVGESMIDCVSHYQLRNKDSKQNILYISTEGTLTEGQMNLIKRLLEKQKVNEPFSIFDNDRNGYIYTIKLFSFLNGKNISPEELPTDKLKDILKEFSNIDLSSEKDWNDDLVLSVTEQKKNEFYKAVLTDDLEAIANIKASGFSITHQTIENLRQTEIKPTTMIAIEKIFSIPTKDSITSVQKS